MLRMAKGIEACAVCGKAVGPKDFEKGDAVHLLGKIYCIVCTRERVARSKSGESTPDFRTPPPGKPKD